MDMEITITVIGVVAFLVIVFLWFIIGAKED